MAAIFGRWLQRFGPAYSMIPSDPSTRFQRDGISVVGFRSLKVWEKAHRLTLAVYDVTRSFPSGERYGLMSQARRSAASICANIAEGCGTGGPSDFARFLQIALGSASELEYELLLAADLGLVDRATHERLQVSVIEVKRMLSGFIRTLRRRNLASDV
jgi:four helix bundle protein